MILSYTVVTRAVVTRVNGSANFYYDRVEDHFPDIYSHMSKKKEYFIYVHALNCYFIIEKYVSAVAKPEEYLSLLGCTGTRLEDLILIYNSYLICPKVD